MVAGVGAPVPSPPMMTTVGNSSRSSGAIGPPRAAAFLPRAATGSARPSSPCHCEGADKGLRLLHDGGCRLVGGAPVGAAARRESAHVPAKLVTYPLTMSAACPPYLREARVVSLRAAEGVRRVVVVVHGGEEAGGRVPGLVNLAVSLTPRAAQRAAPRAGRSPRPSCAPRSGSRSQGPPPRSASGQMDAPSACAASRHAAASAGSSKSESSYSSREETPPSGRRARRRRQDRDSNRPVEPKASGWRVAPSRFIAESSTSSRLPPNLAAVKRRQSSWICTVHLSLVRE